jgi:DNA processing protein
MHNNLLYQIALTLVPNIGCVQARLLANYFENAADIFNAKLSTLEKIEGIGTVRAKALKNFNDFETAAEEIKFIEKYKITPLFITAANYPQRLLHCYDAPTLLYYRGQANLNNLHIVGIIGTRNNSDYGKQFTEKLVEELAATNITVVSGLAFGIDAVAHKAALKNNLPTVGVLAHGLDSIYPAQHTALAKDMLQHGGLLTEFRSNTKPDRHNFPTRNRIVAGMCDALVVVESGLKGGSIITATLADGYHKDVFAVPGKVTDIKSAGCNYLIKANKACLLTDANQLTEAMGWGETPQKKNTVLQKQLLIDLSADEKIVVNILTEKETIHIDELNTKSGLTTSAVAAAILQLELKNAIDSMPGKMYKLV